MSATLFDLDTCLKRDGGKAWHRAFHTKPVEVTVIAQVLNRDGIYLIQGKKEDQTSVFHQVKQGELRNLNPSLFTVPDRIVLEFRTNEIPAISNPNDGFSTAWIRRLDFRFWDEQTKSKFAKAPPGSVFILGGTVYMVVAFPSHLQKFIDAPSKPSHKGGAS